MTLKEVLKNLSGYYFILDKDAECICTNHQDYIDELPEATEEILKQYEDYEVYKISSSYDGWSDPWIDLYIDKES